MDTSTIPIDAVQSINGLFPIKIDNLEYIPSEILHHIFMKVDDLDLLNLADASYRFECIAKTVVKERNAGKYFMFDQKTKKQRRKCVEFFDRIGCHAGINAIAAKNVKIRDANHWLPQLIQRHANQIGKLRLDTCEGEHHILRHHTDFTHLTILNDCVSIEDELPLQNYRNLVKLELACYIDETPLELIIRENPSLESLILSNMCDTSDGILMVIVKHLKHLKELSLTDHEFVYDWPGMEANMAVIVDSLKHLESFCFRLKNRHAQFIHQLGLKCTNLKRLELEYYYGGDGNFGRRIFEAIQHFQSVESLTLSQKNYSSKTESLVEHLINLRHLNLQLGQELPPLTAFIFSLLHRCPSLETITIDMYNSRIPSRFMSVEFFNEFNEIMQKPHGKIQFEYNGEIIGFVSKKEMVKNQKRLHWYQYDWSYNSSDIHLLDLAKPSTRGSVKERNPFECILGYLDLGSLCSLAAANEQSKQLVGNYVQQHAQQNGTFTLTDRFKSHGHFHFNGSGLEAFAEYVVNMRLTLVRSSIPVYLDMVKKNFCNLKKLWIGSARNARNLVGFSQVRHLVVENNAIDLFECSQYFPNIETLEWKAIDVPQKTAVDKRLQFCNLKKFSFKYNDEMQMGIIRELFKNTQTQLILEFTLADGEPSIGTVQPMPTEVDQ